MFTDSLNTVIVRISEAVAERILPRIAWFGGEDERHAAVVGNDSSGTLSSTPNSRDMLYLI